MKTPEEMAEEYCAGPHEKDAFLAGYKAGFEIGCMKGSMAMQSTLDEDYHFMPLIDHKKLAKVMTKKETK